MSLGKPTSDVSWYVNGVQGGRGSTGTISPLGLYMAPTVSVPTTFTITASDRLGGEQSSGINVTVMVAGTVTPTQNPQVAKYSIFAPAGAFVQVAFGPDTSYGLKTWAQTPASVGGEVDILVAGMRASTLYHMQATVTLPDGAIFNDSDHTFLTGNLDASTLPTLTAATTLGQEPLGGIELVTLTNTVPSTKATMAVTDLAGNILWTYAPNYPFPTPNPIKLLQNGHFLLNLTTVNSADGSDSLLEEVDLAGNVMWSLSWTQLNQALAAAVSDGTCLQCNFTVVGTHHDFAVLPNGHLIVIASVQQAETGLIGEPSPITVMGDVLIDLDQNHKPVWAWSSFDHLDLNRHPLSFPDWTHTNAVVYSPPDKALIISMRNQDWILKLNYDDGKGNGSILWKLGYQGDFKLINGTDPVDWMFAQHDVNVSSGNSSGTFSLLMFDNGDQRVMDSNGTLCGTSGAPACYSRVPMFEINEPSKTATLEWVDDLSPIYSFFGGNARLLTNGDLEFDECGLTNPAPNTAAVYEVTKTTPPQVVWQMHISGQYAYRVIRIPSLYPGIQW